ncbi:MAG: hypothetical protein GX210_08020 [Firmicutes bacterium]|nr:hypothetical protein [Bacillota bacterium]
MPEIYKQQIKPAFKQNQTGVFAGGYNSASA